MRYGNCLTYYFQWPFWTEPFAFPCLFYGQGGKAFMNIGLHLLEGNVVDLKLPFLAIEKKKELGVEDSIDGISQTVPYSDSNLEIIGVVRKKIIFKTRPKPTCTVHRNWEIIGIVNYFPRRSNHCNAHLRYCSSSTCTWVVGCGLGHQCSRKRSKKRSKNEQITQDVQRYWSPLGGVPQSLGCSRLFSP